MNLDTRTLNAVLVPSDSSITEIPTSFGYLHTHWTVKIPGEWDSDARKFLLQLLLFSLREFRPKLIDGRQMGFNGNISPVFLLVPSSLHGRQFLMYFVPMYLVAVAYIVGAVTFETFEVFGSSIYRMQKYLGSSFSAAISSVPYSFA